MNLPRFQLNH